MSVLAVVAIAAGAWAGVSVVFVVVAGPRIGRRLRDRQPPAPGQNEER